MQMERSRRSVRAPPGGDCFHMAIVGTAAAPEHDETGKLGPQRTIVLGECHRISCIELGRLVELRVALGGRVGAQPANSLTPGAAVAGDDADRLAILRHREAA